MQDTNSRPDVSVILPTFNRAGTLNRAIDSVLNQTYTDLELLVINDGSNDQTELVLGSFSDPRMHCIHLPGRRGAAAARNIGISQSSGGLIAFQDSDDEWRNDKLGLQVEAIEKTPAQTGVVYCNYQRVQASRRSAGIPRLRTFSRLLGLPASQLDGDLQLALARGNFIPTQTALVKKICLQSVGGFDERLPRLQDWDLWLRISSRYNFSYLKQSLVTIFVSRGGISSQSEDLETAFKLIVQKYEPGSAIYRTIQAQYHFAQGDIAIHQGDISQGRIQLEQARQLSPSNTAYALAALTARLSSKVYLWYIHRSGLSYLL